MIEQVCRLFELIESTKGSKAKAELLTQTVGQESELVTRVFLKIALDPFSTYGVKKIDDSKIYSSRLPSIEELEEVGNALAKREITGHAASEALRQIILVENEVVRKWLIRIFEKNLRFGMTAKSIDKIFPKLVPLFEIGLCDVFDKDGTETKLPKGEWIIDPKLDGLRCLCFIDSKGKCKFLSRGNKALYNTNCIEDAIGGMGLTDLVLDGEIMAKDWNETVSIVHTEKPHKNAGKLLLYVFDVLTMDEWDTKKTQPLKIRKEREKLIPKECEFLSVVPHVLVSTFEEAKVEFELYLKQGFEGAVLKNWNGAYPFGRGKQWLKWKKMH